MASGFLTFSVLGEHVLYATIPTHLQATQGTGFLEHAVIGEFGCHSLDDTAGGEWRATGNAAKRRFLVEDSAGVPDTAVREQTPVELENAADIEVVARGPLFAQLRVTRLIHNSSMTQTITLRRNSRRIDFHTVIDWQEKHKLLKVNFPVDVYANEGVQEIQFGHIRRPNHKSRKFDADRFEAELIRAGIQQCTHAHGFFGMNNFTCNFRQWLQHEAALCHFRMWGRKVFELHVFLAVQ